MARWGITVLPEKRTAYKGGSASDGLGLGSYAQHLDIAQGSVRAGFFEDEGKHPESDLTFAELATVSEFGTATQPARPFMRSTFDKNVNKYTKAMADVVNDVIDDKVTIDEGLDGVGVMMETDLKAAFQNNGEWAANAPATVQKKGFQWPLHETGALEQAVSHRVTVQRGSKRFRVAKGPLPGGET